MTVHSAQPTIGELKPSSRDETWRLAEIRVRDAATRRAPPGIYALVKMPDGAPVPGFALDSSAPIDPASEPSDINGRLQLDTSRWDPALNYALWLRSPNSSDFWTCPGSVLATSEVLLTWIFDPGPEKTAEVKVAEAAQEMGRMAPLEATLAEAIRARAREVPWLPVNHDAALWKYAQAHDLGDAQTDELQTAYAGVEYVVQVYSGKILYAPLTDVNAVQELDK